MNKRFLILAVCLASLILISSASASFQVGNLSNDLKTLYSPGEKISGGVNISFQNELESSLLYGSSGFIGSINLKDFLDRIFINFLQIKICIFFNQIANLAFRELPFLQLRQFVIILFYFFFADALYLLITKFGDLLRR